MNTPIIVGESKIRDAKTNQLRLCKYSDIPFKDGWINKNDYLPIPYDLLYLRIEDLPKILTGWWTKGGWKGLRLESSHLVTEWKRYMEDRI